MPAKITKAKAQAQGALPARVQAQLDRLIRRGLPADQIAFMTRLGRPVVEAQIKRLGQEGRQSRGASAGHQMTGGR